MVFDPTFQWRTVDIEPGWLTWKPGPSGQPRRGGKVMYVLKTLLDLGQQFGWEAVQARFPGLGTPDALPLIARDRRLIRGFNESTAAFALRLQHWLDAWASAGTPLGIMSQVQDYLTPFNPVIRIVNQTGTWYTLDATQTFSVVQNISAPNWNWDGNASLFTRFWLIIYPPAGLWGVGPNLGDPALWGGQIGPATTQYSIGGTYTQDQVKTIRTIIKQWKCGGDACDKIIIAFDPASFSPTAAPLSPGMPDGTWENQSKVSGGVRVKNRLTTARYWQGVS